MTHYGLEPFNVANEVDRPESPPWNMDGDCFILSPADRGADHNHDDDGEGRPPPLSQAKALRLEEEEAVGLGTEARAPEVVAGKSTPSTMSDDAEDDAGSGASKRQDRAGGKSKKRTIPKGVEAEEQEMSEEGHDSRRKPRKSARLA